MDKYYDIVDRFAREQVDAEISNGHILHAEHLLSTMIRYANHEINIFSGSLKSDLFESQKFLSWISVLLNIKENVKMNVLVQNLDEEELKKHKFYRLVAGSNGFKTVSFFLAKNGSNVKKAKEHFATMDSRGYREEIDHDKIIAKANFNDVKKTKQLKSKFEEYMKDSVQID